MFRGQLVELKAIDIEHLAIYTRWFQDPEVLRLLSGRAVVPVSSNGERRWIERAARGEEDAVHFAIHTSSDGQLIGTCSLKEIDAKNRNAAVGIVIGERGFWGKGYGSDALRLMLRYGFAELNLHKVCLRVLGFNERAIRAYRKLGFVEEGRLREAVYRDGRYWDDLCMGILRSEYAPAQAAARTAVGAMPAAVPPGDGVGA